MLLADINLGEIFWSLLVIFFMVIYFMIIFSIFGDLFRSKDLGGLAKALWVLFIFVFMFVGPLVYLIVRGNKMGERALAAQADAQKQLQDYAQTVVSQTGGDTPADHIAKAKELLDSGAINQQEFEALKAKALS
ncbi:MAG: SHOCT domain-containing protein [Microthrixaceae bacterium]|nr:SHOCT domain-containing protein [Microthrixaceae bacterium]MCO5318682.1 SHOCT domain-containing protein [Microthrixaceae bacterium]